MNKRIILASNSPRRRELLANIGLEFSVIADNTPEPVPENASPENTVTFLAGFKGENVIKGLEENENAVVIAADTVVAIDGKILGKPHSVQEAETMLKTLSGRMHCVYTGVYVKDLCTKKSKSFCEKTEVFFKNLDIETIKDYINTGEPMDKAGAYGIQNLGSLFVERINGDYFNVVGLPVPKLGEVLSKDFGICVLTNYIKE
ncbi:MAG: septum formation inhibitor Maf [Clostridia bacterium]|nr:septum formation inhibitor Maf [Clostridia bacterium]